ncbi:hypothetical protein H632_c139p0 [Helicosporidium sp. ATCC 50920]|nr:hypothetical protein H632_c139p0 [Helicosporidium sp. ATCC 50920]|eukprot:KDD76683.1 hypothetical protein H632_c139p0 [Helicosporidium sp. ATCC 50920]
MFGGLCVQWFEAVLEDRARMEPALVDAVERASERLGRLLGWTSLSVREFGDDVDEDGPVVVDAAELPESYLQTLWPAK